MSSVMPEPSPIFNAELLKVIDGDTLDVVLDRWHGDRSVRRLRLLGVDTPELSGVDRERGLAAKAFAEDFLVSAFDVPYALVVQTAKQDRWGRTLAYVWRKSDGASLGTALREAGHAYAVSVLAQIAQAREG